MVQKWVRPKKRRHAHLPCKNKNKCFHFRYIQFSTHITFDTPAAVDDANVDIWYGTIGDYVFNCNFQTSATTDGKSWDMEIIRTESQVSQFVNWNAAATIDFYQTEQFLNPAPTGLIIGKRLNFEVNWGESFSPHFPVEYYVDKCSISAYDDTNSFDVISYGCLSRVVKTRMHSLDAYTGRVVKFQKLKKK